MAERQQHDLVAVRAAQILVGLRKRELRERPEWVPVPPPAGEASSAAAGLKEWKPRQPRSKMPRPRGDWKNLLLELELELCPAAAWPGQEEERRAKAPERRPVEAVPCHGSAAGLGPPGTSTTGAASWAQTKASSPDTPLDFGAGGSGASSGADDAGAKRKARGSGGGDDEGCSSPAKRARVGAQEEEEKPTIPAVVEPPRPQQSETCASSGGSKTGGLGFDLNLPWPQDDDGCLDPC